MILLIVIVFIYYGCYRLYQRLFPSSNIDPNGLYILINGCNTELSHLLAIELDKQGFNVLAGVFIPDDIALLKNKLSPKATVFHLDITKQEDIDAAFKLVTNKTEVLHALINYAEIISGSYIDWTSLEVMRKVMDMNFFGHVAMTKKFLPLLIAKRDSRIVNLSSISGIVSLKGTAAYSASKYALESFSDCLRREMTQWDLRVSLIERVTMRTCLLENPEDYIKNLLDELSIDVQDRWGINFLQNTIRRMINPPLVFYVDDSNKVIRAIKHAIMNTKPRIRYQPGLQSKLFLRFVRICPTYLMDKLLNIEVNSIPAGVHNQLMN
ncbi:unnamed protein product [Rotaria sordida]|uniref:Uncharacterized protein n=1 Tax=Rotaria sordida TaxID=392033 RepID=A0A814L1Z9_9BILA|nr:unnamed protein product [Rotaria sordida]CAF1085654.1 unnamed protein product [Rotaria sordida]CAF1277146.1 unnamed protein product [Rotaria sordida]CAF3748161.1 unnamed protein product [Rotaria sordida]